MNGAHDVIVALRWVQSNIHFFGGKGNDITLFGQARAGGGVMRGEGSCCSGWVGLREKGRGSAGEVKRGGMKGQATNHVEGRRRDRRFRVGRFGE